MRMCHFWVQNGSFAPNKIFVRKTINTVSLYLLPPFIVQNFKKSLEQTQSYEGVPCLGPKWPFALNEHFSEKPSI